MVRKISNHAKPLGIRESHAERLSFGSSQPGQWLRLPTLREIGPLNRHPVAMREARTYQTSRWYVLSLLKTNLLKRPGCQPGCWSEAEAIRALHCLSVPPYC